MLDAGADKVSVNSRRGRSARSCSASWPRCSARSAWCWRSTPRREAGGGYEVFVNGGRTPTGPRRDRVGARGRRARRGGDPADEHGPRRHRGRLRARADARGRRRRRRAGDRLAAAPARSTTWSRRSSEGGADAVLCASIFHYGTYSVREAKERMREAGIPVRLSGAVSARTSTISRERDPAPARHGAPAARARGAAAGLPGGRRGARPAARRGSAVDLDLAVEGDARAVARELAERLGGEARRARALRHGDGAAPAASSFDLATTRRETYAAAGRAAARWSRPTLAEDLGRRDFTVNAMAVGARPATSSAHLHDPHGGRDDLEAGVIRVLHPASFLDDPTRLLRAVRYEARLGFRMDEDTERARARRRSRRARSSTVSGRAHPRRAARPAARARGAARPSSAHARARARPRAAPGARRPTRELVASARARRERRSARDRALAGAGGARRAGAPRSSTAGSSDLQLDAARARRRAARRARRAPQLARALRARSCTPSELHALLALRAARGAGAGAGARRARGARPALPGRPARRAPRDHAATTCSRRACPRRPALGRALRRRCGASSTARCRAATRSCALALELARGDRHDSSSRCRARGSLSRPAQGGVSEGPYESLNLGILTDDEPDQRGREPPPAGRRRRARPGDAWRWAGRCTAPTSASGTGPPAGRPTPARRRSCRRSTGTSPRVPGLGLLVLVADCYPVALSDGGARGDAPLRLARRWPAASSSAAVAAFDRAAGGRGRARASGPAATRSGPRCWRRSRTSRARPTGGCSTCARSLDAQLERGRGRRGSSTWTSARAAEPDLYFSHRRDDGVTGRQGGWRGAGCLIA